MEDVALQRRFLRERQVGGFELKMQTDVNRDSSLVKTALQDLVVYKKERVTARHKEKQFILVSFNFKTKYIRSSYKKSTQLEDA